MIGQTISHYKITAKLGAGGMGEVYLAEDAHLKRKVALKFLPEHFSRDADARSRFQREAEALATLNHPNIVSVFDVSDHEGRPYIVMEYVEGKSFKDLITSGDLDICRIIETMVQLGDGLAAAHEAKIVHRDIKADNIIISSKGKAKIMDFGLATWRGVSKVTREGSTVGTMAYMSPEQAQGREVDHRTDLWSLGVVLYEMITRHLPFAGDHEAAIAYSIANETPHPLVRYSADVPGELQRIVNKCLAKDREERYQSAADLVADLRALRRFSSASNMRMSQPSRKRSRLIGALAVLGVAVIAVSAAYLTGFFKSEEETAAPERKMLVVLPFENLGLPEDEYFADGITEEITATLAKIGGLGVIARTSAIQYKNTDKPIPQIGQELGVDFILEGTIRWEKSAEAEDRVRVTPQLIKVADATHLWAEVYDRALTGVFEVQADIAAQIAEALDIALLEPERAALAAKPTGNMEAYDYYLRGLDYSNRGYAEEDIRIAAQMFQKAVALDSAFVLAYAELSYTRSELYWFHHDRTEDCLAKAKQAADKAFQFSANSPEAHRAMGWYYYHGLLDYDRALEHFRIARKTLKDNGNLLLGIAAVQRRQGKLEEAIVNFRKALDVDPRSAENALNLGQSYALARDYTQAESYYDYAVSMAPDWITSHVMKAWLYVQWQGNTEKARDIVERAPQHVGSSLYQLIIKTLVGLDTFDKDYKAALDRLSHTALDCFENQFYYVPKAQLQAEIYGLTGQPDSEQAYYDSARSLLEGRIQEQPEDSRLHSALGIAYAGLGYNQEAIREAMKGVELLPISKEAFRGYYRAQDLTRVQTMVGDLDAAIDQLEFLLSIPGNLSVPLLGLDPIWDPLRDDPRFQALLEKYGEAAR